MKLGTLPLPTDQLPPSIIRFCDPAQDAARAHAAKGVVPVRGIELVALLAQLSFDANPEIANTAKTTLSALPDQVLFPAAGGVLHPAVLDFLARTFDTRAPLLERIVANHLTDDITIESIARTADDALCERIAANEVRLLGAPGIIEALYRNRNTRMSTADRLIDLAKRNGVELTNIPAFRAHAEALEGQLIPEPSEEPSPSDALFKDALEKDSDEEAVTQDPAEEGKEEVKEKFKPLQMRVLEMSTSEKIRFAMVGSSAARALLVRDHNKQVSYAAISSPMMTEREVLPIAKSKEVSIDVLRYIGNKKEWHRTYELKRSLVFNPKVPPGIALRFVSHMLPGDIKIIIRSKNVAAPIKAAAIQIATKKQQT